MFDHVLASARSLAMKTQPRRRPAGLEGKGRFEHLVDDVLRLVLLEVTLDNKNDLLSIVMVSKRLYVLTVPYLYRDITLDVARSSHQHLLQRLSGPGTYLPHAIRAVSIKSTERLTRDQFSDLDVFFGRLTNLQELHWHGISSVPVQILDVLSHQHPGAQLYMDVDAVKLRAAAITSLSVCTIIPHLAHTQLSEFLFQATDAAQLYDGFKLHLIRLLKRSQNLRVLKLQWAVALHKVYPEMLEELSRGPFPMIQTLQLFTNSDDAATFLRPSEISVLRARGCWKQLEILDLANTSLFPLFLAQTSKLSDTWLQEATRSEWDVLETLLDAYDGSLSNLTTLQSYGIVAVNGSNRTQYLMPWAVIKRAPNITTLKLHHAYFNTLPGSAIRVPTARDIKLLRMMCPCLKVLSLDIVVKAKWPYWPYDVLSEVARFDGPIEVEMFVHSNSLARHGINRWSCGKTYRYILDERQRLGLPCVWPFQVGFKVILSQERMKFDCTLPDYNFYADDCGEFDMWRRTAEKVYDKLDPLSIEDLRRRNLKNWANKIGWDRKGYKEEMQRRERRNGASTGFAANAMLYDSLT